MAITVVLEFEDHDEHYVRDMVESITNYNQGILIINPNDSTQRLVEPFGVSGVYKEVFAIEGKSLEGY
jgi:hypothetical protein